MCSHRWRRDFGNIKVTNKEKSKKLHETADALEEWGKYNKNVSNAAEWSTPAAKQIIRKAMTLLVDNLALLNECRSKYGCHSPLHQCFLEIEQAASLPKTNDLGNCRAWVGDFTERHLWGGEKRSFADECVRYANELNRETEQGNEEPKKKFSLKKIVTLIFFLAALTTLILNFDKIKDMIWGEEAERIPKYTANLRTAESNEPNSYGRTPLYSRTKKRVYDICDRIEEEKLNPWLFINIDKMHPVTRHDGRIISYKGVLFSGAPRLVFWSDDFIPPFIEDAIVQVFNETIEECHKNNLEPKAYIDEANSLLLGFVLHIYSRMTDIDQKLSSQVDSKNVGRKDTTFEIKKMEECLKGHYDAALLLASKGKNTN